MQTGAIGPRVTTPWSPLSAVAPAPEATTRRINPATRAALRAISCVVADSARMETSRAARRRPSSVIVRRRLRRQLAVPRRPVAERGARARAVARATARAEQVVAGAAREEGAAPGGVIAGARDVLAGDPDRVPVDGCRAVVAPAGPRRVADLRLVAREAVGRRRTDGDVVPRGGADDAVDRRVRGTRIRRVAGVGEGHDASSARGDADRRIREV